MGPWSLELRDRTNAELSGVGSRPIGRAGGQPSLFGRPQTGWRPPSAVEVEECQDSRMLYTALKLVHILLAITALGFNASYAIWLSRAGGLSREINEFALRGVQFLDARI